MTNAKMIDSTTAIVTWPVDVWFTGNRTFDAVLDFGGRKIEQIPLDPACRFPDRDPRTTSGHEPKLLLTRPPQTRGEVRSVRADTGNNSNNSKPNADFADYADCSAGGTQWVAHEPLFLELNDLGRLWRPEAVNQKQTKSTRCDLASMPAESIRVIREIRVRFCRCYVRVSMAAEREVGGRVESA